MHSSFGGAALKLHLNYTTTLFANKDNRMKNNCRDKDTKPVIFILQTFVQKEALQMFK